MKTSGNKHYTIKYLKHVIKRNIPSLPEDIKPSIKEAIKEYLETDPIANGVSLRNRLKGHRRIQVGDYRIVYRVDTGVLNKLCQAAFLVQLNFQSVGKENVKLRHS